MRERDSDRETQKTTDRDRQWQIRDREIEAEKQAVRDETDGVREKEQG